MVYIDLGQDCRAEQGRVVKALTWQGSGSVWRAPNHLLICVTFLICTDVASSGGLRWLFCPTPFPTGPGSLSAQCYSHTFPFWNFCFQLCIGFHDPTRISAEDYSPLKHVHCPRNMWKHVHSSLISLVKADASIFLGKLGRQS